MTTIVLDRDRFYGSALARAISRRQPPDDVTLIVDPSALPRLLARDPEAVVIVDEEAVEPTEFLHELISERPTALFVVLVSSLRASALQYFNDGALAVVFRPHALSTLAPAVHSVVNGACAIPPQLLRILLRHFQLSEQAEEQEERLARLSPREHEILDLLVSGKDPTRIAHELDLSIHTVRSHLKRIFRKLEVHSTLEAVLVAVTAGVVPAESVGSALAHVDLG